MLFELAIVDIFFSRTGKSAIAGLDLIPLLRALNPKVRVVLVTSNSEPSP